MTEKETEEFVISEIRKLQSFIAGSSVLESDDPSAQEEVSNNAILKSIQYITATLRVFQQEEISRIKEEYCQKTIEENQKLLSQFSGVLDKAVTAMTYKGPLTL